MNNISAFPVMDMSCMDAGMTLLDYFAGQALIAVNLNNLFNDESNQSRLDVNYAAASLAYEMVVAMMEERYRVLAGIPSGNTKEEQIF